ncbi:VCBS repeat-containing protein [bacterium]|nr:VCBS repeat-containing protein [bacterium]
MSQIPTEETKIPDMASPESSYRKHLNRLNELVSNGESLSGHERNCAFLNIQGGRFATVSSVSGLDFDDDARSPVSIDWDRDGDLDLWVANRTAPQLRFLRNNTPKKNDFVSLRLRGTKSNIDGIGARVEIFLKKKSSRTTLDKNAQSRRRLSWTIIQVAPLRTGLRIHP